MICLSLRRIASLGRRIHGGRDFAGRLNLLGSQSGIRRPIVRAYKVAEREEQRTHSHRSKKNKRELPDGKASA